MQRLNPDLDYTWFIDSKNKADDNNAERNIKVCVDLGTHFEHFFTASFSVSLGYVGELIINSLNVANPSRDYKINNAFSLGGKYTF